MKNLKNILYVVINKHTWCLNAFFIFAMSTFLFSGHAFAQKQNDLDVFKSNWLMYTDASNSLYPYFANQALEYLEKRKDAVSKLTTLDEWKQRQKFVKETLFDIVGPFPEKTPLNANVVRTVERDGYKIEHIIFESQPGFYVTSSLFLPDDLNEDQKTPAILYCSGHTSEGYRSDVYLHVIANLVKKGFIVFAFDPVGQGERLEYFSPQKGKSWRPGTSVSEHSYAGSQSFVIGNSQARYMIWDGIRAIDYLLSRKEVDPARIGITGRSGGGTQSSYIAAFDDRIYAAAPENYLTSFKWLLRTVGPQDAEQDMFDCIERGIDHPDYLEVRAPKPTLMITTTRDAFSIQGSMETAKEVSRVYKAYGSEDNFSRIEDDAPHMSTKKNRESMYAFFQKFLDHPGNSKDEETAPFSEEEIRVTPTGQVATSLGGETIYSINLKKINELTRKLDDSRADLLTHIPEVLENAKKLSGYREPAKVVKPVLAGRFQEDGYNIEKYFVQGEGDYVIPYLLLKPESPNGKAVLYLDPGGKDKAEKGQDVQWFVNRGFTVMVPDLLGIGEIGPDTLIYNHAYIQKWYAPLLIGRSILGVQTADVVKLARLLNDKNGINELYGCARERMAPVLLHAAAFEPVINRIALVEPYSSYRSIVANRFYDIGFMYSVVPAALTAYDLPDLAASLAPRKLLIAGMMNGNRDYYNYSNNEKDVAIITKAYRQNKAKPQLEIKPYQPTGDYTPYFMEWTKN